MAKSATQFESTDTVELPVLIPYNQYSKGARSLAAALSIYCHRQNKGFCVKEGQPLVYINWGGNNDLLRRLGATYPIKSIINEPSKTLAVGNKLAAFTAWKGHVNIPEFTEDFSEAIRWAEGGEAVMGRRRNGSCGEDIYFFDDDLERFTRSDFWVKYKKKKDEFRVHIAFGRVIDVQRKALRQTDHEGNPINTADVDFRIRNLRNGFIFKRHDITVPSDVVEQAKKAMEVSRLDFGAVDVIYNETEGRAYVLEINTAPGLEGTTLDNYAAAFREELAQRLTKRVPE